MPSDKSKRMLARVAVAACLLIIFVLTALIFNNGKLRPFDVLVFGLALGGIGINLYFLYRWCQALARGGSKGTTWLIGAAWLVISGAVHFMLFVLAFARCAGGCISRGPGLADELFVVAAWGIGLGFTLWLNGVRPGGEERTES